MSTVKIGSARIDENGKAHGGAAGDQTGKEVSTQAWYLSSKGWRVFRAKNPGVAEKIAQAMEWACANHHIGYDQYQRNTLYNAAEVVGFDPGFIGSVLQESAKYQQALQAAKKPVQESKKVVNKNVVAKKPVVQEAKKVAKKKCKKCGKAPCKCK